MNQPLSRPAPDDVAALFLADHDALDLLNTVASPAGEPLDWISSGAALCAWLGLSGLLNQEELERAGRQFDSEELDLAACQARALREWLRDLVMHGKVGGAAIDPSPLEAVLAHDWGRPVFKQGAWSRYRELRSSTALLGPVAEAIGDLLINADFGRVRQCDGEGCSLWFQDTSKTNRRRWCSMTICGNRSKVAAHRARKRGS